MKITSWPKQERPREKLKQRGSGALSDAELVAILLHTGSRGQTALDLARALLSQFGNLRGLGTASIRELLAVPGLGPAKYATLAALVELARRYQAEPLERGKLLQDPDEVRNYLAGKLRDRDREIFCCLFVDNRHRVIVFDEMFQGGLASTSVHTGEVVRRALQYQAAAVILAHNHPSGDAEPSAADRAITERLVSALQLVDIRVLDHFVVGDGPAYSFAENGLL